MIRYVRNSSEALELEHTHFRAAAFASSLMHCHSVTYNLANSLSDNFLCLSLNMIINVSLLTVIFLVEFIWLKTLQRAFVILTPGVHLAYNGCNGQSFLPFAVTKTFYFCTHFLSASLNLSFSQDECLPTITTNICKTI